MTMHENPDPLEVTVPSGRLMFKDAVYRQVDRSVDVSGSAFLPATQYSVKLEGARLIGYRSLLVAGIRDPRVIGRFAEFRDKFEALLRTVVSRAGISDAEYTLTLRAYGIDAVLGDNEPSPVGRAHEVGLIIDVVASTQEQANAIAVRAGPIGSRLDVTGKMHGGGNFAYPFSPPVVSAGPVYQWSVWHIMEVDDWHSLFPVEVLEV
jgi:hypothetical protein